MVTSTRSVDDWSSVYEALADPNWDFRTVKGISRHTGLDEARVTELLERHASEVRKKVTRKRELIYTLKSRPPKLREILADLQRIAANSP